MQKFRFKNIYSNGAVFPVGKALTVAGFAPAGSEVNVKLASAAVSCTAGTDGRFKAVLPPVDSFGGPYKLEAWCSGEYIAAEDIYVGMVYLCSGQSNMALTLKEQSPAYAPEFLQNCALRFFRVPSERRVNGCDDADASWMISAGNEADLPAISAVGFAFASNINRELGCAVGIINNSIGGSAISSWIDRDTLTSIPEIRERAEAYEAIPEAQDFNEFMQNNIVEINVDEALELPDIDDSAWDELKLPAQWSQAGCDRCGVYCFRKHFTLPDAWQGEALILSLGGIDQQDVTMVNGTIVGSTGEGADVSFWNKCRRYRIAPELLHKGDNVIVIRAISRFYMVQAGGFVGPAKEMFIAPENPAVGGRIALDDIWKFKVEQIFPGYGWDFQMVKCGGAHAMHFLYDNMFRPVAEFPVSAVVWYQGEADATCLKMAEMYPVMLRALRKMYRRNYNDPQLPFYIVQLPGFQGEAVYEKFALWALVRDAQLQEALADGSFVTVTSDLGDEWEIHPPDKREVGRRLALLALHNIHGPKLESIGKSAESGKLCCRFSSAGQGLHSGGGTLNGFAVAGADLEFYPAQAEIIAPDRVVVWADEVPEPRFAAYGYSANPKAANLLNSDDLPASPFITTTKYPGVKEEF